MTSDLSRSLNYVQESLTFYIEEIIGYLLRRNGIDLELRRQTSHVERVEANILYSFTPSIGNTVVSIARQQRERIMEEVNPIWNHVRSLSRNERGDVLQTSIIIMGTRVLNEDDDANNIFLLIAIVAQLCIMSYRDGHPALIKNAVSAVEYILNNAL